MIREQILPLAVAIVCTAAILAVLWIYLRFGSISEYRTRGWKNRLPYPELAELEARWQVRLPRQIEAFYRTGGIVEREEVYLAARSAGDSLRWYVACFIPLTVRDLAEWMRATNLPGLPVARDAGKGVYYLPFSSLRGGGTRVLLRDPIKRGDDIEVAPSLEEFLRFVPVEVDDEDG
jgi:hypothetical protein